MNLKSTVILSAFAIVGAANATGIAGNSLVVLQEGGTTSAATSISLLNYSTGGSLLNTINVAGVTQSGSATSEGALNLNAGGGSLSFVGYSATPGTTSVVGGSSARLVASVNVATGAVTTSTTGQFLANNIRSAYTNGTTYYAAGANSGLVSGTVGGPATQLGTMTTNLRTVQGVGSNVFFSTGSGTAGIYQYDASATGKQTLVVGTSALGGGTSPYDFDFVTPTTLLVADDSKGISLYTKTGSTWALSSTLAGSASRSIALLNNVLYFSSADGLTIKDVSLTNNTFGSISTLATTTSATPFRSVEAVPEPSAIAALGLGAVALLRRRRKA